MKKSDFLVIGSGVAGMSVALHLSKLGQVFLFSKTELVSGSSKLAQGGISISSGKDKKEHYADTMRVGSEHNNPQAVQLLVDEAHAALLFLEEQGVEFDKSLHKEAGHSRARIFHIADKSGLKITTALAQKVRNNKNIEVLENAFCYELIEDDGVIIGLASNQDNYYGRAVILASGGAGQVYKKTTNPEISTGDGWIMAKKVGAQFADMEFVQFHPTALDMPASPLFLLSEALRGEGARVVSADEQDLCDPLLPRDELARIVFREREKNGQAFLSLKNKKNNFWQNHFPQIFAKLTDFNLNPEKDLLPITPATHFFCGGIQTDLSGQTNKKNLFALGEIACTGVHGANRLASNSLLEAVVFAKTIYQKLNDNLPKIPNKEIFPRDKFIIDSQADFKARAKIQNICFSAFGVLRKKDKMQAAQRELDKIIVNGTESQNLLESAKIIADFALKRKKSLGCHFIED